MTDDNNLKDIPQATVIQRKRIRLSVVWIIPILAAVVAIGIAAQRFISQGPTISIAFKAGTGIEVRVEVADRLQELLPLLRAGRTATVERP